MSEQNQDDRLNELMAEFMNTSEGSGSAIQEAVPNTQSVELQNKIEEQKTEINQLKGRLIDVFERLDSQAAEKKQKETPIKKPKPSDSLNFFSQLEDLPELDDIPEKNMESVQSNDAEFKALQAVLENQASNIERLESKLDLVSQADSSAEVENISKLFVEQTQEFEVLKKQLNEDSNQNFKTEIDNLKSQIGEKKSVDLSGFKKDIEDLKKQIQGNSTLGLDKEVAELKRKLDNETSVDFKKEIEAVNTKLALQKKELDSFEVKVKDQFSNSFAAPFLLLQKNVESQSAQIKELRIALKKDKNKDGKTELEEIKELLTHQSGRIQDVAEQQIELRIEAEKNSVVEKKKKGLGFLGWSLLLSNLILLSLLAWFFISHVKTHTNNNLSEVGLSSYEASNDLEDKSGIVAQNLSDIDAINVDDIEEDVLPENETILTDISNGEGTPVAAETSSASSVASNRSQKIVAKTKKQPAPKKTYTREEGNYNYKAKIKPTTTKKVQESVAPQAEEVQDVYFGD